jgi:hypothetical protein
MKAVLFSNRGSHDVREQYKSKGLYGAFDKPLSGKITENTQ